MKYELRKVSKPTFRSFFLLSTGIMSVLIFATNNQHKLNEVQVILGEDYCVYTMGEAGLIGDIPEEEDTLEGNASCKAGLVHEQLRQNCFADDTGLEVAFLDGAPGVFSARFAAMTGELEPGEDPATANIRKLLRLMDGAGDRTARFRTVISLFYQGTEQQFEGVVEGSILESPRGDRGFGYDPVFMPDGYTKTFAEMSLVEKNKISHRARAIARLQDFLKKNPLQ